MRATDFLREIPALFNTTGINIHLLIPAKDLAARFNFRLVRPRIVQLFTAANG